MGIFQKKLDSEVVRWIIAVGLAFPWPGAFFEV